MTRKYTPEQHAWISERYADMTNTELAEAFNERFDGDATQSSMNAYGSNHKLRKAKGVRERALRKYTDEQLAFMRDFIPGHEQQEIIDAYEDKFGERLTVSMVAGLKIKLGVISGTHGGCFERGHEPPNKGKTWDEYMSPESQERCRATHFRKGSLSGIAAERKQPLLSIREGQDGYLQIKVAPRNIEHYMQNWISLAQFVWMQANGQDWPEGHSAVFADRDNRNFSPDNIVPVPEDVYVLVTGGCHGHALPWYDRESLEVAITHALVMRERHRLEMAPRMCWCCGQTFEPEYKNQRTCRPCLDAGHRAPRRRAKHESQA